ncbi:4'-phosphopantetheinyl transferase family protein [Cellulomonas hominis]|uniref:4'-phosphopantetheinyl transferase family protein n=1 Tax=Cellulomonas hominis TaxID=156981 RepID=UPI0020BFE51B|nr:4'-phosphopantetheinyl transferase superfamily protein [Cellulomonas hominis]
MPEPASRPVLLVGHAVVRPGLAQRLTTGERLRVDRAAPAHRDAVASALLLARCFLADACGVAPDTVRIRRRCPRCGSTDHGVPWAARADGGPVPHLSTSRTGDRVAVALSDAGPVGIDVERRDADPGRTLAAVALAPGETPAAGPDGLLRTWVRKEAVLKAAGTGLTVDPRALVIADGVPRPTVRTTSAELDPPAGARWWLTDLDLGDDHLAALAGTTPGSAAPEVRVTAVDLTDPSGGA